MENDITKNYTKNYIIEVNYNNGISIFGEPILKEKYEIIKKQKQRKEKLKKINNK